MFGIFKKSSLDLVFRATLHIREISNLTLHSGRVYVSWKVKGFGKASGTTKRQKIEKNRNAPGFFVVFDEKFIFDVDMKANSKTMLLEDTITKVGVYHESASGRAYERLGKIHVNLSEYTGTTSTKERAYLLQQSKINGTVIVGIKMERIKGFPTFRVPAPTGGSLDISSSAGQFPGSLNSASNTDVEFDRNLDETMPSKLLSVEVVEGKRFLMSPEVSKKANVSKQRKDVGESQATLKANMDLSKGLSGDSVGFPSATMATPPVKRKARTHIRTASGPFHSHASAAITASRSRFDVDGVVDDILDAKSPVNEVRDENDVSETVIEEKVLQIDEGFESDNMPPPDNTEIRTDTQTQPPIDTESAKHEKTKRYPSPKYKLKSHRAVKHSYLRNQKDSHVKRTSKAENMDAFFDELLDGD